MLRRAPALGLALLVVIVGLASTASVASAGTIVVKLDAQPEDTQSFSFTAGGGLSPAAFTLSEPTRNSTSSSRAFSAPGGSGYSIAEAVPSGWDLKSATCSDGSPVSNINLHEIETVTCTFVNELQTAGHLTVTLDTDPDSDFQFNFRSTGGPTVVPSIRLQDNGNPFDGVNNIHTVAVKPGSGYNLFLASDPGSYTQRSATCSDGSAPSSIDVSAGENITCAFSYKIGSSVTVVEDAQPNGSQSFNFTTSGGLSRTSFSLTDFGGSSSNSILLTAQPGSGYSITQSAPVGWDLASATCSDGSPVTNIDLVEDEHVTCTFVNQRRGGIKVVVDTQPDNNLQQFSFTAGGGLSPTSFTASQGSSFTFDNVPLGSGYSLTQEATDPHWTLTSATCSDGSPVTNISLSAGEVVTCAFVNKPAGVGHLTLRLDTQPDTTTRFNFRVNGGPTYVPSILLQDNGNPSDGVNNVHTFPLESGTGYNLFLFQKDSSERWVQQSATCSDGSPITNIDISPNENVTCTIVLIPGATITIHEDSQPEDPQDFAFTTTGGISPANFSLDDDSSGPLSNIRSFIVAAGTYSVAEVVPAGWELASATCTRSTPGEITPSNIVIGQGQFVNCYFVNRRSVGQIRAVVDARPDDPTRPFSFTAGGGLSPTSFTLTERSPRVFNVPSGSGYSLSQSPEPGWDLTSATCSDGSPASNISLGANEVVTCTFVNQRPDAARLTVVLDSQPDADTRFNFRADGGPTFVPSVLLQDNGNPGDGINNQHTVLVAPGSGYRLFEYQRDPGTLAQQSATCSDGSPVWNIDFSASEDVTCTFVYASP